MKNYLNKLSALKLAHEQEKAKPPPPKSPALDASPKSSSSPPHKHSAPTPSRTASPTLPTSSSASSNQGPNQRALSTLANLLRSPQRILTHFSSLMQDLSQDDSFLRTLLFAAALILVLLRRDVRVRLKLGFAWIQRKIKETIVMGGKVGYL